MMSRRQYDSSKTRVAPVFDALHQQPTGWVGRLLDLAAGAGVRPRPWRGQDLSIIDCSWGDDERALPPPPSLLEWLVRNGTLPEGMVLSGSADTVKHRRQLLARDPATIDVALARLRRRQSPRGWHIFEGPTCPDAFIETPDALIVVEGKRTESGPTTYTTWMPRRHQIWRHLDAAWEMRGHRAVYGFFVVEAATRGESAVIPAHWLEGACATLSPEALEGSLPHRDAEERRRMTECFLGVTTWQAIVAEFGLSPSVLLDRVHQPPPPQAPLSDE